jgi:DNA-binding NarL/FixJ family response regulator
MNPDILKGAVAPAAGAEPCFSVLVISPVRFLREAVGEVIAPNRAFSISALSGDLEQALSIASDREPDIVLLDAAFPDGVNVVGRIRQVASRARVIVLAVAETEEEIVSWAEAGASGYIPNGTALTDLVSFLADIMRGEQPCSGRAAAGLLRRVADVERSDDPRVEVALLHMLTAREKQIVQLIDAGLSNKDIARRLNIEVATTKSHVHNLLGKLDLQRRGQISFWVREVLRHSRFLAAADTSCRSLDTNEWLLTSRHPRHRRPA